MEPFNQLLLLEEDVDGDQSPWLDRGNFDQGPSKHAAFHETTKSDFITAQRILLHADDDSIDLSELTVLDNLVPFDDLGFHLRHRIKIIVSSERSFMVLWSATQCRIP